MYSKPQSVQSLCCIVCHYGCSTQVHLAASMHYGRSAEMGTKKLHSVSSEAVIVESTAVIHRENLTVGSILAQKEEYV